MAVTYITRDGMKIDGTTGQDHLLEVIYGHALTRMLLHPFLSPAVSDICGKFLSTRLSRRIIPSFVKNAFKKCSCCHPFFLEIVLLIFFLTHTTKHYSNHYTVCMFYCIGNNSICLPLSK